VAASTVRMDMIKKRERSKTIKILDSKFWILDYTSIQIIKLKENSTNRSRIVAERSRS
jgi:hypothetical protein